MSLIVATIVRTLVKTTATNAQLAQLGQIIRPASRATHDQTLDRTAGFSFA